MADIVKRLRALDTATCEDAADEIERLRADIDNARLLFSEGKAFLLKEVSELITTVERSENENAKLRAALEGIADLPVGYADMNPDHIIELLVSKARAALGGEV